MRQRMQKSRAMWLGVFFLVSAGCFSPVRVRWDQNQPIVNPRGPAPQGRLTVYSECYQSDDEESLSTYRRTVFLYTSAGHLLGRYGSTDEHRNDPVQLVLAPGRYIVVSQANGRLRKVQVIVEDGGETIVSTRVIARSPLAASS